MVGMQHGGIAIIAPILRVGKRGRNSPDLCSPRDVFFAGELPPDDGVGGVQADDGSNVTREVVVFAAVRCRDDRQSHGRRLSVDQLEVVRGAQLGATGSAFLPGAVPAYYGVRVRDAHDLAHVPSGVVAKCAVRQSHDAEAGHCRLPVFEDDVRRPADAGLPGQHLFPGLVPTHYRAFGVCLLYTSPSPRDRG